MSVWATIAAVAEVIEQDIPLWAKLGGGGVLVYFLLTREWKRMDGAAQREEARIKASDEREAARLKAQDEREAARLLAHEARLDRWERAQARAEENQDRIFGALKSIVKALHDLAMTQPAAMKNLQAEADEKLEQAPRK